MKTMSLLLVLVSASVIQAQEIKFFSEKDQLVYDNSLTPNGWIKVYKDAFVGYVDEAGVEVVPPVYDSIEPFGDFHPDLALTVKGPLLGFIDTDGNAVVEPIYESIQKTVNPAWFLVQRDGLFGVIDASGSEIIKTVYSQIDIPMVTNK